ncbi:MAG: von Willebrand factor type A domain protein [Candidatus Methanolliviera sp. GoM_asphalt]|nr:MAG: von Willebrand factor type A domain protein [Candidatus Methanolliviera sp. GoM_asphalt]
MTHHIRRKILPFTAIVGQEKMKKALILNAINPKIGGVLIRGEKGTAKSTAVRALADLLPEIDVVKGCPFNCNPNDINETCDICYEKKMNGEELEVIRRRTRVIDLPLGATEDRVVGSLNVEKAIREGIRALEPGILADANRGILYIDEVNLLDDHVADVLLDSAAMGVNVVEREGVSVLHPSKFILVGTMNPEEGELRPQLLDRFGLQVGVESIDNVDKRVEIIKVAEGLESDPDSFIERFETDQRELREKIEKAKPILKDVETAEELLRTTADTCIKLGVRSHRAEITIVRTAKTIAALDGRKDVTIEDIKEAMELALPHRMRTRPFEPPNMDKDELEMTISQSQEEQEQKNQKKREENNRQNTEERDSERESDGEREKQKEEENIPKEFVFDVGNLIDSNRINARKNNKRYRNRSSGRSASSIGNGGKYIKSKFPNGKPKDIALDATIRAAAPYQQERLGESDNAIIIKSQDMREKVRVKEVSTLCAFVVDSSGSMGAKKRMESAKGAIFSLLLDSYQKRDKVALVSFRGEKADILLPPSSSVERAANCLRELPTGGRTPLSAGLYKGLELLDAERRKDAEMIPMLVLISDGRGNVSMNGASIKEEITSISERVQANGIHAVIIDTETSGPYGRMGYNREIAEICEAEYYTIDELSPGKIGEIAILERDKLRSGWSEN